MIGIKGMKMPVDCDRCRFYSNLFCKALGRDVNESVYIWYGEDDRDPDCPLVEIKEESE